VVEFLAQTVKRFAPLVPATILIIALLTISGLTVAIPAAAQSSTAGCPTQPFRETLVSPPNSLNFLTLTTGSSSVPIIFTEYSNGAGFDLPNGNIEQISAMADWIKSNANYTMWEFNAKPGAMWSDGTPVTAQDFLATFGPNFGMNATYDFAGLHTELQNEYALNSSTAVFVLNQPDSQWWQKLRSDYYTTTYPAEFVNAQGAGGANFGTDVAYGPFYVSNYTAGSFTMTMYRNPHFVLKPHICEVDVNFVDSLSETSTYLTAGTTDFAFVEYSNAHAILASNPNLRLYDEKGYGMTDIQYNDTVFPYNMTAFRQALAWSMNQSAIVKEAFDGYGLTAYNAQGAVSPIATTLFNSNAAQYGFDLGKAASLLQSIGITKGSDGLMHYKNGTAVTLNLWADTDNTADPVAAQIIAANLQSLGIKVNVQTTTAANIVGDYSGNSQNIRNAMILATINVGYAGNAFLDTLPGWDVYWLPTVPNKVWLWPQSANNQWNSNVTAFGSTSNTQQDTHYLLNIEGLNAQYLPSIVVAYPDKLFAVNTQYYTNYPPGNLIYYSYVWNWTGLATIEPTTANPIVGATTTTTLPPSTTTTVPPTTTTTQAPPPTTTASAPPTTTTSSPPTTATSSTPSAPAPANNTTLYAAVAIVAIIVIIAGAVAATRTRKKPAS
jgi:ABC-type transport system substrate-binding protein